MSRSVAAGVLAFALCASTMAGAARSARAQSATSADEMLEALRASDEAAQQAHTQARAAGSREHYVIAQYREALITWMHPAERAQLAQVDTTNTAHADPQQLRSLVADRALRRMAPLALELVFRTRDAEWLRSRREMTEPEAVARLLREGPLALALRRRDALADAGARALALAMARTGRGPRSGSEHSSDEQDLSADRALLAAADCASRRDVSEAARTAFETAMAAGTDEDRARVVLVAVELLRELTSVARGLPLMPLAIGPIPGQTMDPFETGAPAVSTGPRSRRSRASLRAPAAPRPHAPSTCMDRYDCYGY